MEVAFYRCDICKRLDEKREMIKRIEQTKTNGCVCGSRRFRPTMATGLELFWFVLKHPSYFFRALAGAY